MKRILKKTAALLCAVGLAFAQTAAFAAADTATEESETGSAVLEVEGNAVIKIDGTTLDKEENSYWRGFGFISANNSSRLLLDYKSENPDAYWKLLELMFSPDGPVRMNHLKIEMGADINSSSGTEPSTMRSADEPADVTRGAGFQLAADAKQIAPDLTLELLSWGAPGFVKNASGMDERRELRYKWFKDTLDAAYDTYGLEFDYIDPNYNEKGVDSAWIKYFSESLNAETDTPYPYDEIKIVIADEDAAYNAADNMLRDEELMKAVDVIGIHYTSTADEGTLKCKNDFGKQLWYSEGLSPAVVEKYAVNADGSGISGVNSMLDVAGRIVNMYPNGGFTLYEFQPAISAYYSGTNYFPKQLITANEPWSGHYDIGAGMYMAEHFSLFTRQGWQFVKSACYGDGREESHVLYDTTNNYLTLADPETGDYSMILVNNTELERSYDVKVSALEKAAETVQVWETRGPDEGGAYDSNYLKNTMSIEPEEKDGEYCYSITVKPYSMVTVSTVEAAAADLSVESEPERLGLPYEDDFEYSSYSEDYLAQRGYAPRYTTDIGGAFEVVEDEERGNVLMQKITADIKGVEWGGTPDPVTTLGDDCWANYTVSADVKLAEAEDPEKNYVGIGLRYINSSANMSKSGYHIDLYADGTWKLMRMRDVLKDGSIDEFDAEEWHTLSITAFGDTLTAAVDGVEKANMSLSGDVTFSGRAALYSAYYKNCYDDLSVIPVDATNHVVRLDQLDSIVEYDGEWNHNTMDSFTCHNRTSSENSGSGDSFRFTFEGDSLALIGTASKAKITVEIDDAVAADGEEVSASADKSAFWHRYSLGYGEHTVKVTVDSGSIKLDAIEYGSRTLLRNGDTEGGMITDEADPDVSKADPKKQNRTADKTAKLLLAGAAGVVAFAAAGAALNQRKKKKRG